MKGGILIYKIHIQSDDAIIEQCGLAALRAWEKLEDAGKSSTLFTKIVEGSWKPSQISCKDWFQL